MKSGVKKYILSSVLGAFCVGYGADALAAMLSPDNFNKMYYVASQGRVDILRQAINRGLDIDSVNAVGDTGLCIAIKRKNQVAFNSFRMVGANTRHPCTYRISEEYRAFLNSGTTATATTAAPEATSGEYLYYNDDERSWWPWIIGGTLVGGGVYLLTHHKHSSGDSTPVMPENPGHGLAAYVDKYIKLVNSGESTNSLAINGSNSNAAKVVDKIKFLPNILNNLVQTEQFLTVK